MTAAVNQSPATGYLRVKIDRKTTTTSEIDRDSYGSSSEDIEIYSPKSVVTRQWPKKINVRRNQIERIRAEDSHLGEEIGEFLIVKICGGGEEVVRPASPLGGKVVV